MENKRVKGLEELSESQLSEICGGLNINKIKEGIKKLDELRKKKKELEAKPAAPSAPPPSSGTGGTCAGTDDSSSQD